MLPWLPWAGVDLDGLRIFKAPGRPMSITAGKSSALSLSLLCRDTRPAIADGTHFSNSRGGSVLVRRW